MKDKSASLLHVAADAVFFRAPYLPKNVRSFCILWPIMPFCHAPFMLLYTKDHLLQHNTLIKFN